MFLNPDMRCLAAFAAESAGLSAFADPVNSAHRPQSLLQGPAKFAAATPHLRRKPLMAFARLFDDSKGPGPRRGVAVL